MKKTRINPTSPSRMAGQGLDSSRFGRIRSLSRTIRESYLPQIYRFFPAKIGKLAAKMAILASILVFLAYNLTSPLQLAHDTMNKQANREEMRKKQAIEKKITFWEKEIEEKPDYRDAFLNLAVLNFQVRRPLTAREYWMRAKEIDPNNEMVGKVEKIIK